MAPDETGLPDLESAATHTIKVTMLEQMLRVPVLREKRPYNLILMFWSLLETIPADRLLLTFHQPPTQLLASVLQMRFMLYPLAVDPEKWVGIRSRA